MLCSLRQYRLLRTSSQHQQWEQAVLLLLLLLLLHHSAELPPLLLLLLLLPAAQLGSGPPNHPAQPAQQTPQNTVHLQFEVASQVWLRHRDIFLCFEFSDPHCVYEQDIPTDFGSPQQCQHQPHTQFINKCRLMQASIGISISSYDARPHRVT